MTIRTRLDAFSSMSPARAVRALAGTSRSDVGAARTQAASSLLGELTKRPAVFGMSSSNPERGQPSGGDYHRLQARVLQHALDSGATLDEAIALADAAADKYRYGQVDDETRREVDEAESGNFELSASNARLRRLVGGVQRRAADARDRFVSGMTVAFA